jgi:hypothetical protein
MSPEVVSPAMNSQLFHDLNQRYFTGRLPRYHVIVTPQLRHAAGKIARRSRRIYLQPAPPDMLMTTLLHEMAHAATNDRHGPLWRAEMERLRALGAPVEELAHLDMIPRLTRQMVFSTGWEVFANSPTATIAQAAHWLFDEYGFGGSGSALLRKYPWARRALHEARREAGAYRRRMARGAMIAE